MSVTSARRIIERSSIDNPQPYCSSSEQEQVETGLQLPSESNSALVSMRFQTLQRLARWTDQDAHRLLRAAEILLPNLCSVLENCIAEFVGLDTTDEIDAGEDQQIQEKMRVLISSLSDVLSGETDAAYAIRRWEVYRQLVTTEFKPACTNVALALIRSSLSLELKNHWHGNIHELFQGLESLNKRFDLELMLVQDLCRSEQARRIRKLDTIGQVAGGIAHELRNPLNVLKTSAYYLVNSVNLSPQKLGEHLGRIRRQVDKAEAVIQALADFARLPTPNRTQVACHEVIRDAVQNHIIPSNIQLVIQIDDELSSTVGDKEQLEIAVGNLVRNAIDAMPQGGAMKISVVRSQGDVLIAVRDEGVGIASDQLSKIMEPLFTTKPRGFGLGLAITQAIVENHQGILTVSSKPNCGSEFVIRLKAHPPHDPKEVSDASH